MGEYGFKIFKLPSDKITKFLLNSFLNTRKLYDGLHELNVSQNYFIQDFYCPVGNTVEFLKQSEDQLSIFPIWLCPMKPAHGQQKLSPHFINSPLLIDIGIWGQSVQYLADPIGKNRQFEAIAKDLKARKMLYAHAYYTEEEFWRIYDKNWYDQLRKKYHAVAIFPDIWEKTHVRAQKYKEHFLKGIFRMTLESLKGKHLNT